MKSKISTHGVVILGSMADEKDVDSEVENDVCDFDVERETKGAEVEVEVVVGGGSERGGSKIIAEEVEDEVEKDEENEGDKVVEEREKEFIAAANTKMLCEVS